MHIIRCGVLLQMSVCWSVDERCNFLVLSDDVDIVSWINSCHLLNYLLCSEVS